MWPGRRSSWWGLTLAGALLALALSAPLAQAEPSSTPEETWITNGTVNAIASSGETTYIGGADWEHAIDDAGARGVTFDLKHRESRVVGIWGPEHLHELVCVTPGVIKHKLVKHRIGCGPGRQTVQWDEGQYDSQGQQPGRQASDLSSVIHVSFLPPIGVLCL